MSPVFTLEGLAPGGDYVVTVTAINRKGTSPTVSLEAFTLKVAENRMSEYLEGVYPCLSLGLSAFGVEGALGICMSGSRFVSVSWGTSSCCVE